MESGGKISEWNEATLKTIRLHEIQGTINLLKMDSSARSNGKFNYEWLLSSVDGLYGEGYSKYSKTEREEVDKLRNICFKLLKFCPPHSIIANDCIGRKKSGYLFNKDNFEMLMDAIEMFVRKVKDLNDDHGLTTKNKGSGGLFG